MIIEMPLWLAIVLCVAFSLEFIHCLISDFLAKLIHKKYDVELKEKEKHNESNTNEH